MQEKNLTNLRHSLAHLLAAAVLDIYPDTKLTIGPATDNGFYYDFEFSEPVADKDLAKIEKRMKELLPSFSSFQKKEISREEAENFFEQNEYKRELIEEIAGRGEELTLYSSGPFIDLCRGGHIDELSRIDPDSFKLSHLAGAYWRGNEKNKMLTRIYGLAFDTKEDLAAYEQMLEEAKKRDHKKLGKELDLFTFSDTVGKGLPLWTHKGATVRRELERFIVDEEIARGYEHVYTPDIAKIDLYKKSGHYPHYKDSMYAPITIDEEEFMLRPMTCPHHFELFLRKPHSYRELPIRIAELAKLYRYEQSGELSGLQRVRSFCLADAHIICKDEEEAIEEIGKALDLIEYVTGILKLKQGKDYWYRLSLGDRDNTEKYFKNDSAWEKGEGLLREFLEKRGSHFVEAKGEAAFYGPKIDIQMRNVNGKEDTAFTVQYDFCMPERFSLTYTDSEGEDRQPLVIHRSSVGAIERIMAFLIEHYAGAFPTWLSPMQVSILPVGKNHEKYAGNILSACKEAHLRAEIRGEDETLGKRIRNAKLEKIPYILVVGDKEIESETVSVESRDKGQLGSVSMEEAIKMISGEIKNRQ